MKYSELAAQVEKGKFARRIKWGNKDFAITHDRSIYDTSFMVAMPEFMEVFADDWELISDEEAQRIINL